MNKLVLILENIFVLNSILIFIGIISNLGLFKSYYSYNYRYGYNGLIPAINEASLFYIIAVSHFYYKSFILKEKTYKLYIILAASCFLGSKAIIIFNLSLLIYHLLSIAKKRQVINAIFILFGFVLLLLLFVSSQIGNSFLSYFYYASEKHGVISMLLSGRDAYVKTRFFENIEYWKVINYFLGGQDQLNYLTEMDLFDVFLFFGIIGSMVYFYLLFKSIFNFKYHSKFTYFFISMFLILGFLGGHFFTSALNALYLVLFCLYQQSQNYRLI